MKFFQLSHSLQLNHPNFYKHYQGANEQGSTLQTLYLNLAGETSVLTNAIFNMPQAQRAHYKMHFYQASQLVLPAAFPIRLGEHVEAFTLKEREEWSGTLSHTLMAQLDALKQRPLQGRPYRIALVNGFGHNLGDTLLGCRALAVFIGLLKTQLSEFTLDILVSYFVPAAIRDWLAAFPEVDQMVTLSPTLVEFCDYDGYLDVSDVFATDWLETMPTVDAFLLAMGINPDSVMAEQKRNRITLKATSSAQIDAWLSVYRSQESKLCYLAHSASVPLRSMPTDFVRKLVDRLLGQCPQMTLIADLDFAYQHPRLIPVADHLPTVDDLAALIDKVDMVICVDSLVLHLSDALSCPTLCISATLSPDRLQTYYPHAQVCLIKEASKLPAWQKGKVSESAWQEMQPLYLQAWLETDLAIVDDFIGQNSESADV
ncbi:glycosyltransferase family 9 protein [Marinomonas fungiae]|uniref:glycosyltransferase family 9 protein n=1 Tax=Marinomonas fungiae TaxID=1137284 RepID=UPI003A8EDA94